MARMTITKEGDPGDFTYWHNDRNDAFITFEPAGSRDCGVAGLYVAARMGDRRFWCQDAEGNVYSFHGLLDKDTSAPTYMRRMARQAQKDIGAA
jgi:hypothetical protein